MERQSRRELLEVIEQQKEQLGRYETRLRDVVRAYKGLAKEKETLETSLKAINAAYVEENAPEVKPDEDTGGASDVESIAESTASSEIVNTMNPRIAALSSSLATVTTEKAQNEAKFAADKRKMRKEKDDQSVECNLLRTQAATQKQDLEETKSKLIIERHEREKEMNNNILMIKELQKVLSDERNAKERYAEELELAKSKVTTLEDPAKSRVYENQIREIQAELDLTKKQLSRSEKQIREQTLTMEQLHQLQFEMQEMKKKHSDQLQKAERVAEEAELRAIQAQGNQEKRVGNLEARLQELSETVGAYERSRHQDQSSIARLKDQLSNLNMENVALARAASTEPPEMPEDIADKDDLDPKELADKISWLKNKLLEINPISNDQVNMDEVFALPDQQNWKQKCQILEEKLGNMKMSSPSSPGVLEEYLANSNQTNEVASLQEKVAELKTKLADFKDKYNSQELELKQRMVECLDLKEAADTAKELLKSDTRKQMQNLRLEFQEHRERSLTLLQEKDDELLRLRNQVESAVEDAFFSPERQERQSSKSPGGFQTIPSRKVSCDIMEMTGEVQPPLHYVQELARKEVEIKELRRQQYQTETTLRELQLSKVTREEKYQDQIEELEENMVRLTRMTTAEGASIEYLKNVVLNYMLSTDMASKNHMLKAIGAVLRLTKKEMTRVQEHNAAWWWQQGKPGQSPGRRK